MDYIHFNPVKHGLVEIVKEWPYSTFQRCVERGYCPQDWREYLFGCRRKAVTALDKLNKWGNSVGWISAAPSDNEAFIYPQTLDISHPVDDASLFTRRYYCVI